MANIVIKDGAGSTKYLDAAGDGTDIDPHIPAQSITSVVPGTGATNLGKAEDAAHSSGDVGVAILTVRQDAAAALAGSDADYQSAITDASGALWTRELRSGAASVSQTPTITAGAYSAKDAVGGLLTFANAVRAAGGSAMLNSVILIDHADVKADLELWLFNADPTVVADNEPFDISDANLAMCVGVVPILAADYHSAADNGVACVRSIGLQFKCAATSLYGQLKCTATPTYAATDDLTVVVATEYLD